MSLHIDIPELISDLIMQGLLIYITYVFWKRYLRTSNTGLLTLAITFSILMVAHLVASLIMVDLLGYRFPGALKPHHLFFMVTLIVLIYLAGKTQWRVKLHAKPMIDPKDEEKRTLKNKRTS